jgi:hypothetical protein
MPHFLASAFFRLFLVPILSVALGIYIKYVTKHDQFSKFSKEDIAVGFDLMRAAFLAYLLMMSDGARGLINASDAFASAVKGGGVTPEQAMKLQQVVSAQSERLMGGLFGLVCLIMGMWITSTIVRKKGWKSPTDLDAWYGIALPLAVGVAYLAVVMLVAS